VPWKYISGDTPPDAGTMLFFDFIIGSADPGVANPETNISSQFTGAFCDLSSANPSCKPDGGELVDHPDTWCHVVLSGQ
jgi:hypothetical protein